jgi:TRAP-type C4-dicarboxylate transport system permease small subunit
MNPMRLLLRLTGFLALPLALLLFAQWPLRELIQAYSRQANDVAQIVFALYMAVAITAASVGRTHLAALHAAHTNPLTMPRWRRWALLICVAPWALFLLWASEPIVTESVRHWERFGETLTPGYFLIKLALVLLLLLVLLEAVLPLLPRKEPRA